MSTTDVRGSLKYESWMHNKIGVDQIYSPSGLYSILVHKDVIDDKEMFCLKEIFILNNNDFEVQQYKLVGGTEGIPMFSELLNVYWWTDTFLVCMDNRNSNLVQKVYTVNHENQSIHYKQSKFFFSSIESESFWISHSCIVLNKNSYIAHCTIDDENVCSFYIHLFYKNPFSNKPYRKYYVRLGDLSVFTELEKPLHLGYRLTINVLRCSTHKNKLLCPLSVVRNEKCLKIFGVFLAINVDKLENIAAKIVTVEEIVDRQDKDVFSIVYLPKPDDVSATDFYTFQTIKESQYENFCITEEERNNSNIIKIIDFKTMHHATRILPKNELYEVNFFGYRLFSVSKRILQPKLKNRPSVFTMHPSGFILQWFITEEKIEFRKINISWKSESLEEISRKTILYNPKMDYSNIEGMEQFLFPGAKLIQKVKPTKIIRKIEPKKYKNVQNEVQVEHCIKEKELNKWLAFVIVGLLFVVLFVRSVFVW